MKLNRLVAVLFLCTGIFPVSAHETETDCLVKAAWLEARGRPQIEVAGVMHAVLNRVKHRAYPSNVCAVLHQKGQFELKDYRHPKSRSRDEVLRLTIIASQIQQGDMADPTHGATHFWTPKLRKKLGFKGPPGWAKKIPKTVVLGEFVFHKLK